MLANSYSRALLRVAADVLSKKYPKVDYFPSYEIVTSFGTRGYIEGNVHVKEDVVEQVVSYMAECYINPSDLKDSVANIPDDWRGPAFCPT
ncbi:GSCFA domain-containing protein [Sinorhizobium meliloti]|uniref:GSCFA domain-containing protein n=1 Tax=Rhizobium meliloti TaxID=382 RepID=UPI0013E3B85A|nr:GSCFA domain-containing protein [Sinorhizobium meliloti]QND35777.1 GSCFA domain-containing protein [Sinorhizobium meliloti]